MFCCFSKVIQFMRFVIDINMQVALWRLIKIEKIKNSKVAVPRGGSYAYLKD